MLEIKGFIENSLLEWDGKIASVIFLSGCNFKCSWCHVPDLAFYPQNLDTIPLERVKEIIHRQKGWLDGIVISGGEPTAHPSLPEFISRIKGWGLPVKIEINGSHPEMLRKLIKKRLIDSVAMDIKNIVESDKYERTVGIKVDLEKIKESIDVLMRSKIDYEFRTTVVPGFLGKDDVEKIAKCIEGAKKYVLQQFVPENTFGEEIMKIKPYSRERLEEMAGQAQAYVEDCQVRGI